MDQASKEKTVVRYPRHLEVLTIKSFVFYDCGFHGLKTEARDSASKLTFATFENELTLGKILQPLGKQQLSVGNHVILPWSSPPSSRLRSVPPVSVCWILSIVSCSISIGSLFRAGIEPGVRCWMSTVGYQLGYAGVGEV